ncbi:hypothetical protein [Saccharibacter floricola]|nr:hypothetical protein [Saccharibacter floricola]
MSCLRLVLRHYPARLMTLTLGLLVALTLLDVWAYRLATKHMEHQLALFQENCRSNAITLSIGHVTPQGWPFGAGLSLSHIQFHTQHDALQIGGASTSVQLGGSWATWLLNALQHRSLPLLSNGETILRFVAHERDLTIHLHKLHLTSKRHATHSTAALSLGDARFTSEQAELSGALNTLSGKIYWNTHPSLTDSALAIDLKALQLHLNHPNIPLHHPLTQLHVVAALPGCHPFLLDTLTKSCILRLHELSADLPLLDSSPHVSLGGKISIPEGDGAVTLQVTHWRNSALQILERPEAQQQLSPAMLEFFQRALTPPSSSVTIPTERPLSMSVALSHGLPTGLNAEKLRMIQRFLPHTP